MSRARAPHGRRGHAALEFALVLPVLLLLVVAVLDWGGVLAQQTALVQIARDAASMGSRVRPVNGPIAAAQARCLDALTYAGFDAGTATVTVQLRQPSAGQSIEVAVRVPYRALSGLLPVPTTLSATVTMRMEAR